MTSNVNFKSRLEAIKAYQILYKEFSKFKNSKYELILKHEEDGSYTVISAPIL